MTVLATKKSPLLPQQQHHLHHRLRFVCVNDVYSFDDVDSNTASNNPRGGWCRAATLMKRLACQQEKLQGEDTTTTNNDSTAAATTTTTAHDNDNATTVLTVVNGDVLGGSSLLQSRQGSIAIEVMNSIPIDLAVLGNHEFDHGDEILMQRIHESNFVWLGSNVYYSSFYRNNSEDSNNNSNNNYPLEQEKVVDHNTSLSEIVAHDDSSASSHYYFPGIHGNGKLYTLPGCGIKVGLFGLVTKVTPLISYPSKRVTFDPDILSVARRVTRSLRARGAQIIVAITHLSEEEDRMLAMDKNAGVDLILGGHEHEPLAVMVHRGSNQQQQQDGGESEREEKQLLDEGSSNTVHPTNTNLERNEGGVLIFKCGMNAYWVGSVNLDIAIGDDNTVTSISTSWSMEAVNSQIDEDVTVSQIVKCHRMESEESAIISNFGESLASTIHLDDVVATIGDEQTTKNVNSGNDSNVAITKTTTASILPLDTRMSSVRRHEATGGNLIADAMLWMLQTNFFNENDSNAITASPSLPMLAMINGGFIRGDTLYQPGSDFTVRDVLKELPFPHTMKVLEIGGADLKEAILQQLKGSSKGPTGAYPHFSSNASLRYDLGDISNSTDSDGSEQFNIYSFTVNGIEVHDEHKYNIAVTTFVADGNEGCTAWLRGKRIENSAWTGVNMSCVLLKYLQCHGVIYPVLEGRVVLQRH